MKVLTATREKQGWRNNDFSWTVDGELVMFPPIECDCAHVDDECGCRRAMAGLVSHRATTTMKVVDRRDLDLPTYAGLITDGLKTQGYLPNEVMSERDVIEWVYQFVGDLLKTAAAFEPGTVLERRGDRINVRR